MSRYKHYKAIQQPETYRSWPEAFMRQRPQTGVLAVGFIIGAVLMPSSSMAGSLIMLATGISLVGTIVSGRYLS